MANLNGNGTWSAQLRRMVLAGVGAVSMAKDEVQAFVEKAVERGEIAEKDGKSLLKDIVARQKKNVKEGATKLGSGLDGRLEKLLGRMRIATKGDIQTLTQKVEAMASKMEKGKARK